MKDLCSIVDRNAPLHRNVTTGDVGGTALYLASDLAHDYARARTAIACGPCFSPRWRNLSFWQACKTGLHRS